MGKKVSEQPKARKVSEQPKDRKFGGTLYPDSTSYDFNEVIAIIEDYFDEYAFIMHDKDILEDGSPKKEHVHWVAKKKNGTMVSTVAKKLGLKDNEVEMLRLWKNSVQYLIHYNDEDKAQYNIEDIKGNLKEINKYFEEVNEGEVVTEFVDLKLSGWTYYELLKKATNEGHYAEFRRNVGIIDIIWREIKEINENARNKQ